MEVLIQILLFASILYVIWQYWELKKFRVTSYEAESGKISSRLKMVVIADLHSFSYGKGNQRLLHAIREEHPDLILIPGDLIVTSKTEKYEISAAFAEQAAALAPVIYSNGNHESRAEDPDFEHYQDYLRYRSRLEQAGVLFLNNAGRTLQVGDTRLRVSGLEIPLTYYEKCKKLYLEETFIQERIGEPDTDMFQILLAHNPEFAEQYAEWGADITICGHNHGGLINIPGIGSIISSQLLLFPKYDAGEFTIGAHKVYISRGLGTHTFHVRICNRAELVAITVKPTENRG